MSRPSDEGGGEPTATEDRRRLCDFCRLPIPESAVTAERHGETYRYCSAACRDAVEDSGSVFTQYHGFRRTPTGVAPLDDALPQGVPRNSFVLLSDLVGTRSEAVQAELVWRALQRGEPVVVVSFLEPPMSVVQEFVTLDWNVLPYLESGQLHIVDCFTYRLENRERMYDRLDDWNRHLSSVAEGATSTVRDPSAVGELQNRIDAALESHDMEDQGIVVIDSLTELGSLVQPIQAYQFLKNVRAEVPKSRFVPVFAGATVSGENRTFPHDLEYMVDGIVELSLDDEQVEGSLLKRLRVRKMRGVLTLPQWVLYEYTAGEGIVTIEPHRGPPHPTEGDGSDGNGDEAEGSDGETGSDGGADEGGGSEGAAGGDDSGGDGNTAAPGEGSG
jgi:KaiC/GvpD/RAD55 family RecA-like ATPase